MKKTSILVFGITMLLPLFALAAETSGVNTFADIPFLKGDPDTQGFVTALYQMSIGLAAIAVVIRLIMAGAKYMLSEVVTNKSEAKEDIKGALLGLLVILSTVLILGTINPKLVGLDALSNGRSVNLTNTDTKPIKDNIDFKPGATIPAADIASKCGKGGLSTGVDEQCVKDNEASMLESCKHNGGSNVNWKYDLTVHTGGYSYYSYTCE